MAALAFIVLALLIDIVNFGAWVVFIAMLAIGFVFGIATFGTFTVADVIFARGFSVFTHRYSIPFIFHVNQSLSILTMNAISIKNFQ